MNMRLGCLFLVVCSLALRGSLPSAPAAEPVACPILEGPPPRTLEPGYTIPTIDLAGETDRQVVVDREKGQYLGHPTTVLLEDHRTMLAVYPKGHGAGAVVMKRSADAGLTWSDRLPTPENWARSQEVPTLYRTVGPDGRRRLIMFSGLYPIKMARSEDDGRTWTPLTPIGDFGGIVAMASCVRLADGSYMALFHDDGRFIKGGPGRHRQSPVGKRTGTLTVYKTLSGDGGLTWSDPIAIAKWTNGPHICEPGAIRSPDGKEIALLLRENSRKYNSMVIFSRDEGKTWTPPRQVPAALTGDRHVGKYAPDGRLLISFRDTTRQSPTKGDWVMWVGTYEDIKREREGQYRVRLMDNHRRGDCAYPAVERLPDGTFIATTYGHWTAGEAPYIVSVRFKLEEIDAKANAAGAAADQAAAGEAPAPAPEKTVVFKSGTEGYHTYRIPALLVTPKDTLLAFCEGRKTSPRDQGDIDLLLKRSTDGGRTWSDQRIVHEEGGTARITIGNPCPILDRTTGTVHLLFCRNNSRCFTVQSTDDGRTWTEPRDITAALEGFDYDLVRMGTGPVHGIQLTTGRLVAPVWVSNRSLQEKNRDPTNRRFQSGLLYSDDHGRTWHAGGLVPPTINRLNECTAYEGTDGRLYLNMRAHGAGFRAVTVSRDGGESWAEPRLDRSLPDPTCQGATLRYSGVHQPGPNRVLVVNAAVSKQAGYHRPSRRRLTVRLSRDDGATWAASRLLEEGPAAYSDLAVLPDDGIGCLYETGKKGPYETITFARFPPAWVRAGSSAPKPPNP